jgi:hypothetical protein
MEFLQATGIANSSTVLPVAFFWLDEVFGKFKKSL